MGSYTLERTIAKPYLEVLDAVKEALALQGFGVLTEIDLSATLRTKLGVSLPPQVILGACRPQLAYEALQADPSIAAILPCNVVVRAIDDGTTVVEAFDPATMVALAGGAGAAESGPAENASPLATVARDARQRLQAMLDALA